MSFLGVASDKTPSVRADPRRPGRTHERRALAATVSQSDFDRPSRTYVRFDVLSQSARKATYNATDDIHCEMISAWPSARPGTRNVEYVYFASATMNFNTSAAALTCVGHLPSIDKNVRSIQQRAQITP